MKVEIAKDVKLAIAVAAIKTPAKAIVFATQFGVSESTVRRAIKAYEAEAKTFIEAELNADKQEGRARGWQGRNGRMSMIRQAMAEVAPKGDVTKLEANHMGAIFDKMCELADQAGIAKISRSVVTYLANAEKIKAVKRSAE